MRAIIQRPPGGSQGQVTLWTRRLDGMTGMLGAALRLDTGTTNVHNPQIEAAANGIAIASWYHAVELNIWAAVWR